MNIEKIHSNTKGRLLQHNNRTENDGVTHANKQIDKSRTHLNYHFKYGTVEDMNKRLSELYVMNRKDRVEGNEICISLPVKMQQMENLSEEQERKYFKSVYDFFVNEYRDENIINAVVHKDEVSPHLHIEAIPSVKIDYENITQRKTTRIKASEYRTGKEYTETLNAKQKTTRAYLMNLHPRLNKYVNDEMGFDTGTMCGTTANGKVTILELKKRQLDEELKILENEYKTAEIRVRNIENAIINSKGLDKKYLQADKLLTELELLSEVNEKLLDIVKENNIDLSQFDSEINKKIEEYSMLTTSKSKFTNEDIKNTECKQIIIPTSRQPEDRNMYVFDRFSQLKEYEDIELTNEIVTIQGQKNIYLFPYDTEIEMFKLLQYAKDKENIFKDVAVLLPSNDRFKLFERVFDNVKGKVTFYHQADTREKKWNNSFNRKGKLEEINNGELSFGFNRRIEKLK